MPSGIRLEYAFITALCSKGLLKNLPFTKKYWLGWLFFAKDGRPTNPLTHTTVVSVWISIKSFAISFPAICVILCLRFETGGKEYISLELWMNLNSMSVRERATFMNSETICRYSTLSDLRNFLLAGIL